MAKNGQNTRCQGDGSSSRSSKIGAGQLLCCPCPGCGGEKRGVLVVVWAAMVVAQTSGLVDRRQQL